MTTLLAFYLELIVTREISLLQPEHSRGTFQFIISKLSIQLVSWRGEANHQWNHWKDINIL